MAYERPARGGAGSSRSPRNGLARMLRQAPACTAAMIAMVARTPTCRPIQPASTPATGMVPKLTICIVVTTRPISSRGT